MIASKEKISHLSHLQCWQCHRCYPADRVISTATCEKCGNNILLNMYENLSGVTQQDIDIKTRSMWRYFSMLPVFDKKNIVSLGEGFTPILSLERLAKNIGLERLLVKDESSNPTGSFKARGMSMAVSKAKELGIARCIVPTAGNAGGALSAYCAKAGMEAVVVMPEHTPAVFKKECLLYGAKLVLVNGLISDCAKRVAQLNQDNEYFDMSTLKEPYRLEGKKTMGYEIAEQMDWKLPDIIFYPTGGGTGLIGMWKAFNEMVEMGWIPPRLPRMIAVQVENCKPIVETWLGNQENCKRYSGKATIANGLAVPHPFGEGMIIATLKESQGKPMSVSDEEITSSLREIAKEEGILMAPEGAALLTALKKSLLENSVSQNETVLLLNTGSGYKYLEGLN